jgi:hypothetical protein
MLASLDQSSKLYCLLFIFAIPQTTVFSTAQTHLPAVLLPPPIQTHPLAIHLFFCLCIKHLVLNLLLLFALGKKLDQLLSLNTYRQHLQPFETMKQPLHKREQTLRTLHLKLHNQSLEADCFPHI